VERWREAHIASAASAFGLPPRDDATFTPGARAMSESASALPRARILERLLEERGDLVEEGVSIAQHHRPASKRFAPFSL
jgi:hypothetical protein